MLCDETMAGLQSMTQIVTINSRLFNDFIDFSQKCNCSVNYKVNCLKLLDWIVGKHMQHISNGFCHVTFSSHSWMDILMVWWEYLWLISLSKKFGWYFSLIPINFSYTIDARFVKHSFMIHLCMLIIAMYILVFQFIKYLTNSFPLFKYNVKAYT